MTGWQAPYRKSVKWKRVIVLTSYHILLWKQRSCVFFFSSAYIHQILSFLFTFYSIGLLDHLNKKMATPIRSFELNTGAKLPSVGLGTYALVPSTIEQAIKVLHIIASVQVLSLLSLICFNMHSLFSIFRLGTGT